MRLSSSEDTINRLKSSSEAKVSKLVSIHTHNDRRYGERLTSQALYCSPITSVIILWLGRLPSNPTSSVPLTWISEQTHAIPSKGIKEDRN